MKVSDDAKKVFESVKTGKLYDVRSNQWDIAHREYSQAVTDAMKDYIKKTGVQPETMTTAQAREFVTKVFESTDPRIKNDNVGIQMREIAYRLFRRSGRD